MRNLLVKSLMMLAVMVLSVVMACGGGDDVTTTNTSGIVDGVHVNSRKLKSLTVERWSFRMEYDSQGRLIAIEGLDYNSNSLSICKIDYDLRMAEYINGMSSGYDYTTGTSNITYKKGRVVFSLNDKGYISQIGNCSLNYNSDGYLIGANSSNEVFTYAYNNGDVVKSMVETIRNGKIDMYYLGYGEDASKGELYFYINDDNNSYYYYYSETKIYRAIAVMVAYQAGLFGKTGHRFTELPNNSNKKLIIERIDDQHSQSTKITCTCEFV